jgi:phage protein D
MGAFSTYELYDRPLVLLRVEGEAASDIAKNIIEMSYDDHLRKIDQMSLVISDVDYAYGSDARFMPDALWEVRFGYARDMSAVRKLKLKYYEPTFDAQGVHTKRVVLMGRGSDLVRVKQGRNWGNIDTSEIAKKIAKRHGLKALVDASGDTTETPYVQTANEDDYAYLRRLADDIDFEFFVDNDLLVYRSRDTAYSELPRHRLVYGGPGSLLLSFKPTVKATKSVNVKVRATNTATGINVAQQIDNANVVGKHLARDLVPTRNPADPRSHATSGKDAIQKYNAAKRNYKPANASAKAKELLIDLETGKKTVSEVLLSGNDTVAESVRTPETNVDKVKKKANAVKRHFLDQSVEADADMIGTPIIASKATFTIVLPEPRLTGAWYCTQATHRIMAGVYTVSAKLKRGAYTEPRARAPAKPLADAAKAGSSTASGAGRTTSRAVVIDLETGRHSKAFDRKY